MQFAITLPTPSPLPLYKQISNALRDAILAGRLQPGEKLPSTRELADTLKISRLTVSRGVEDLASQGYIQTILGSGSYVSTGLLQKFNPPDAVEALAVPDVYDPPSLSFFGERVMRFLDFETKTNNTLLESEAYAAPDDQLPVRRWREMLFKASRFDENDGSFRERHPFGYRPLREAIAGYLSRSRSINCDPEQIAIFSSNDTSIDLILRLLLDQADTVAVENPGDYRVRKSMFLHAARILPTPVDQQGMMVSALSNCEERIKLVYTTPSHNEATGATLSLARRHELLDWAKASGAIIVEDDIDCEYRYGERLLPSLAGLDTNQSVIYRASFWKVLFPLVRFSFLVLPARLVKPFMRAKSYVERDFPILEQMALTELINEGHFERHIKRSQIVFARKRAATILALTTQFKNRVSISAHSAGLHLLVTFPPQFEPARIERSASVSGLPLVSSSPHYMCDPKPGEYLLGFAQCDLLEIAAKIDRFARELGAERETYPLAPALVPTAVQYSPRSVG